MLDRCGARITGRLGGGRFTTLACRRVAPALPPPSSAHPQPAWLIESRQAASSCPRGCAPRELLRVDEPYHRQAHTTPPRSPSPTGSRRIDRERRRVRREANSNHFATALQGFDIDNPAWCRAGRGLNAGPRSSAGSRTRPSRARICVSCAAARVRTIKITLPGPSDEPASGHRGYDDEAELARTLPPRSEESAICSRRAANRPIATVPASRPEQARGSRCTRSSALEGATGTTAPKLLRLRPRRARPSGGYRSSELAGWPPRLAIEAAQRGWTRRRLDPIAGKP